ncbi:MAG: hypothetical protein IIW17_09560 [Clostridia bacterium]|nr:hypothetical protein [Clostridia bacterium]
MNFDYENIYQSIYKKLPMISAIAAYVLVIVWAIVDWTAWLTGIGDLRFAGFLIWLGIGGPFAALVGFLTMVFISPIVVQTDMLIQMDGKTSSSRTAQDELSTQVQACEINQATPEELTSDEQDGQKRPEQDKIETPIAPKSEEELEEIYKKFF